MESIDELMKSDGKPSDIFLAMWQVSLDLIENHIWEVMMVLFGICAIVEGLMYLSGGSKLIMFLLQKNGNKEGLKPTYGIGPLNFWKKIK